MARIRSIKPEFCSSVAVAALSKMCRLHFVMLWTHADDEGRGIDNSMLIKAALWPLDPDVTADDIEGWQRELASNGRVTRYEIEGRYYFEITNFKEHQHPNKPRPSLLPPPSLNGTGALPEGDGTPTEPLPPVDISHVEKAQVKPDTESSRSTPVALPPVVGGEGRGVGAGAPRAHARPRDTFAAAVELLLLRLDKPSIAKTKGNPTSWLDSARRGLKAEHHDRAIEVLKDKPGISPEELAETLVPAVSKVESIGPRDPTPMEGVGKGVPPPPELKEALRRKLKKAGDL